MVTPTELRQHRYCARIVFYERCTPVRRRETRRMTYGRAAHDRETSLERERTLQRYGLHEGQREFGVKLVAPDISLSGEVDLIVTANDLAFPVEFKDSTRPPDEGHRLQLCAYGLLIEAARGIPSPRGYWHSTRTRETIEVEFTARLRARTLRAIRDINDFIDAERCPAPVSNRAKCLECELKNFCGDVR